MAREINIRPVLNGFLVEVGCQRVVITSVDELQKEVGRYYRNPEQVEKEYQAKAVNRTMDHPIVNQECATSPGEPYRCEPPPGVPVSNYDDRIPVPTRPVERR